jgi:hypothetical protein
MNKDTIRHLIVETEKISQVSGSYPYLPEIMKSLEMMESGFSLSRERRAKMAGALGRLITEDSAFAESPLGSKLLKVASQFARM